MLDFFSGTIYIHHQKAGSSRNNYCIGLSFELIVRRVVARLQHLLSFFVSLSETQPNKKAQA